MAEGLESEQRPRNSLAATGLLRELPEPSLLQNERSEHCLTPRYADRDEFSRSCCEASAAPGGPVNGWASGSGRTCVLGLSQIGRREHDERQEEEAMDEDARLNMHDYTYPRSDRSKENTTDSN